MFTYMKPEWSQVSTANFKAIPSFCSFKLCFHRDYFDKLNNATRRGDQNRAQIVTETLIRGIFCDHLQ